MIDWHALWAALQQFWLPLLVVGSIGVSFSVILAGWAGGVAARRRVAELEQANALLQQKSEMQHEAIGEARQVLAGREERIESLQLELSGEQALVSELSARLEATHHEMQEKVQLLQHAREQMKLEFEVIAQKLLEEKSARFSQQNRSEILELLSPFRQQVSDFRQRVEDVYERESRDRVGLVKEIAQLKALNQQMSTDAVNLTRALKNDSKVQGNWGEVVLERILEQSGLRVGSEYETQPTYLDASGRRLRPDVVVSLPDAKHIVIDSKVSLTAWERYCAVEAADARRPEYLQAHLQSLRQHGRQLSAKAYSDLVGLSAPDFVLMFVPVEPAFLAALEADEGLFARAFDDNVMMVGPSTLLATLKTIHNIWRHEHQNANALEIAVQAGQLHDQFVLFAEAMEDIGDKLAKASDAYGVARKRLIDGRGNLVRRVEQLQELGAKTRRQLPSSLRDEMAV